MISIQHCDVGLNFKPQSHWPDSLPAVAINGVVIAGFDQFLAFNHQIEAAADHYADRFARLFQSLHPDLGAVELAEFFRLAGARKDIPLAAVFETQQVRWSDTVQALCKMIAQFSDSVRALLLDKRISFGDLQPLFSAAIGDAEDFFIYMKSTGASRTLIRQCLELWVEVRMMNLDLEPLKSIRNADEALWFLKVLRYPETTRQDEQARQLVKKIALPPSAQARWHRDGDRSGIELKLFVSSPSDLKKCVHQLEDLEQSLKNLNLWGGH